MRAVSDGRLWFQVYAWRDRGLVKEMIDRAAAARYEALVLTVDTAVFGRRERDVRRGFSLPPTIGPGTILDGALHPGWTWSFVRSEPIRFANVVGRDVGDGASPVTLSDYINTQFDPALSWDDVDWLRSVWDGPIVLKGIQTVEDAVLAADAGVDAIALSNHGGRQLDGAPAAVRPRRPGRRRRRRPHRDHLRRRRPPRQRHRQGRRRRRHRRAWPAAPTSTPSARPASAASTASSTGSAPTSCRTMSLLGAGTIADLDRSLLDLPIGDQS